MGVSFMQHRVVTGLYMASQVEKDIKKRRETRDEGRREGKRES